MVQCNESTEEKKKEKSDKNPGRFCYYPTIAVGDAINYYNRRVYNNY